MNTKPILFWPKPLADIESRLGQAAAGFLVVDTNCIYDLQKLTKIMRATPVFDPFPRSGEHYREFSDHVAASGCRPHVVGMKNCRNVLNARKDPSLAHASIEELVAAMALGRSRERRLKIPVDWSRLNWSNTALAAILVFAASLTGNVLFFDNSLIAAAVAVLVFTALYAAMRIGMQAGGRES
jgi:hypothetical protein